MNLLLCLLSIDMKKMYTMNEWLQKVFEIRIMKYWNMTYLETKFVI